MARIHSDGYSMVVTNHVAAVRTGEIKAQYPMATTLAAAGAQNGRLYVVNDITKEVSLAANAEVEVYLHNSEEQVYGDGGADQFILKAPKIPRMLKLNKGDIFETDAVDLGAFASVTAAKATDDGAKYGEVHTNGDIKLTASANSTAVVQLGVVEFVLLPNGKQGVKFVVL